MKIRKIIGVITVALFLLISALPLYGMLLPGLSSDSGENRAAKDRPDSLMPGDIEEWFDDNFALRGYMTGAYNFLSAKSGVEVLNGVAIGEDGWLYYMYDGSQEDIKKQAGYSPDELNAMCASQQAAKDYLAELGISYYLMVCPDKHTVYPEYLPKGLKGYEGASRFDGLLEALTENTDVAVIDTRQAVTDAKAEHTVFFKTDTHWNAYGAFAGYKKLMERILKDFPNVRVISEADCTLTVTENWLGGDMAGFIGQGDTLTDTKVVYTVNGSNLTRLETRYAETSEDPERLIVSLENPDHPELPTAVIFRDSFCRMMYPMLADSFSKVTFVWSTSILDHIVETEMPDMVIMQYVERYSSNAASGMNIPEAKIVNYESGNLPLPENVVSIRSCVDALDADRDVCTVSGWAFMPGRDAVSGEKHIGLMCGDEIVWCVTSTVPRADVTSAYGEITGGKNLDMSGFTAYFAKSDLHSGKWNLIVAIDDGAGSAGYAELGKRVRIN